MLVGGPLRILEARDGIVVGERQNLHSGRRRTRDEFGRSQGTIGAIRMGVQVDIERIAHDGLPASPTA